MKQKRIDDIIGFLTNDSHGIQLSISIENVGNWTLTKNDINSLFSYFSSQDELSEIEFYKTLLRQKAGNI